MDSNYMKISPAIKFNRAITGCFFTLLVILTLSSSWCLADSAKKTKIVAVNEYYDFGFVPIGFTVVHVYKIYNDGSANLIIDKLVPNCDCTTVVLKDTLVLPGDTTEIKIHFNTENYYGPTKRHIAVHTNDPENPVVYLEYSSNIGFYPKLFGVAPKSLFFLPGNDTKDIQLVNRSKEKIEFFIEMENDSVFTIDRVKGVLSPGVPVAINIRAHPRLAKGTHESNLAVTYMSEKKAKITIPVKIARF